MNGVDPLSIVGLAVVAAIFWVPLGATTVLCIAGVLRARRRPEWTAGRRSIVLGVVALAVALAGCSGAALTGYGYVLGTSMGGYTPPLESALFSVATLSPSLFALAALPASAVFLIVAIRRRRK